MLAFWAASFVWQDGGGLGNIAHLRVPNSQVPCHCGRRGCLEQLSGGFGVVRAYDVSLLETVSRPSGIAPLLRDIIQRASDGEQRARRAFERAGQKLAYGIDAALALLAPDEVILAGEIGRQRDFVAGVRAGLSKIGAPLAPEHLHISQAKSAHAAASIAMSAFVLSADLDIERLKAA